MIIPQQKTIPPMPTKDDGLLIIKTPMFMTEEDYNFAFNEIIEMRKTGTVLLRYGFDAVLVPRDVKICFEDLSAENAKKALRAVKNLCKEAKANSISNRPMLSTQVIEEVLSLYVTGD